MLLLTFRHDEGFYLAEGTWQRSAVSGELARPVHSETTARPERLNELLGLSACRHVELMSHEVTAHQGVQDITYTPTQLSHPL